jgi:ferrochelatase
MQNPTGVLLINLGTPKSPSVKDVRAFLGEFLRDPYVIDIHPIFRWLLLHFIILPFRPRIAALAYQKIWTAQGSPLLFHTRDAARKLQEYVGADFLVKYALRYGAPSIESVLTFLLSHDIGRLIVIPLYPQYASSTFDSTRSALYEAIHKLGKNLNVAISEPFYDDPGFIDSFVRQGKKAISHFSPKLSCKYRHNAGPYFPSASAKSRNASK